jgi:O-antigen ligase
MAAAALGGSVLTLAHPSATRQFTWPWVALLSLLWIIPIGVSFAAFTKPKTWHVPGQLVVAGLLVLIVATLVAAATSPFISVSLLRIWPTLAGATVFLWVYDWLKQSTDLSAGRAQLISRGMAGFGAIIAVVSLVGWRWASGGRAGAIRNDIPFGHSTYTAGILLLLLPWLIRESLSCRGVQRLGWIAMTSAGFASLLATSSRGGVLALGIVGGIGAGFILIHAQWPRRSKAMAVCLVAGIVLIAVFANPRLRELVRNGGWGQSSRDSNAQRSAMIEAGWQMGLMRPWTGWGPGTVPLAYPQLRSQLSGGVDNVLQLHNTPIQLWAALGVGGICALLLSLAALARRLWQLCQEAPLKPIGLTAAASVIGYGLFALTDHQLDLPAMNALFMLNLALLFQNDPAAKTVSINPRARQLISFGTVVVLAVPLFLIGRDLSARHAYERSLDFFEAGMPGEGQSQLETAARRAPCDPYYRHQIAGRLLTARFQTSDPATQRKMANEAASQLKQSLSAGYFQEFANLNLGWLALEDAKPSLAAPYFVSAAREAPHRGGVYFGLGLALRDAGDESAAVRAFALEWINDPIAFTAPVWEWPDFASLRPKIEREANTLLGDLASTQPECRYVRQLWAWWAQGTVISEKGYNQESDAFAETLRALAQNKPLPIAAGKYVWARLFTTWKEATVENEFVPLVGTDSNFLTALFRRKTRHPFPDWHGFFTAGVEDEAALIMNSRSQRPGYGVLALHPDGPILTDLYVRQQNRIAATFASTLFPAKGWILASDLVNRLPTLKTDHP